MVTFWSKYLHISVNDLCVLKKNQVKWLQVIHLTNYVAYKEDINVSIVQVFLKE